MKEKILTQLALVEDPEELDLEDIESEGYVLGLSDGASLIAGSIKSGSSVVAGSDDASLIAGSIEAGVSSLSDRGLGGNVVSSSNGASVRAGSIESLSDREKGGKVVVGSDYAYVSAQSIKAGNQVLRSSESSSVFSDSLIVEGSVGEDSEGSLLVSRELDVGGEIYDGVDVITREDMEGVLTYTGDWGELRGRLEDRFEDGVPEALKVFRVEEGYADTVEQVEEEFEEIKGMYEEVREEHQRYIDIKEVLDLEDLNGSNEDRFERLKSIRETAREKVQKDIDIEDENVDRLLDSNRPDYLREQAENIEETDGRDIASFTEKFYNPVRTADTLFGQSLDIDSFIEEFYNGSEEYTKLPGFEAEYMIDTMGENQELTEETEQANQKFYKQGIQLLKRIRDGNAGKFEIKDDKYQEMNSKREKIAERIDKAFRNGEEEKGQELVEKKRDIEQKMQEKGDQYIDRNLKDMGLYEPENLSMEDLKEGLNQLYQERLKEGNKVYEKAKNISNSIEVAADEIGDNTIRVETWEKDITDLPSYKEYKCCIFPGPFEDMNKQLPRHMTDKDTQFLEVQAGDHKGIAITTQMDNPETGENYLVVNGVESSSNMFKREKVTEAVDRAITEYAEELEMDAVIYNDSPVNTAPADFVDNLEYGKENVKLEKEGYNTNWLETELGDTTVYHNPIENTETSTDQHYSKSA